LNKMLFHKAILLQTDLIYKLAIHKLNARNYILTSS